MTKQDDNKPDRQNFSASSEPESGHGRAKLIAKPSKPRLLVDVPNPDQTVSTLRDILMSTSGLYDRGGPVRLVRDTLHQGTVAREMTPDGIILETHTVCRPRRFRKQFDGSVIEEDTCLPRFIATMYLNWWGEWQLPPLDGITSAPLLANDGQIRSADGYDETSRMWCENLPDLTGLVPERPTKDEANAALQVIRSTFNTFCFADAEMVGHQEEVPVVDLGKPPGQDESAFLTALLTAVCRPSLHLAPGVLVRGPLLSGAGAGKGLLARCICVTAFGRDPFAVTGGANGEELDKRIAAELIAGGPTLFLDNLNNMALKSDLLASAITERPARIRILGKTQMMTLNASAFIILTGNALSVTEDLARRFISIDLDPKVEDPEARPFTTDLLAEVKTRRVELLAALLTIWRWGRLANDLKRGRPLGSFQQWGQWVRDPLLALGCQDPIERMSEAKVRDGRRSAAVDLFEVWWKKHADKPVTAKDVDPEVLNILDRQGRSRQYVVSQLERLDGARVGGYVFTRQKPAGIWGVATYALRKIDDESKS